MPNQASGMLMASTSTISVRRLNCSQRRRGLRVMAGEVVTSGILGSTVASIAPSPTLVKRRRRRDTRTSSGHDATVTGGSATSSTMLTTSRLPSACR